MSKTENNQSHLLPPVDIVEDAQGITLYADMPGVPRDLLALAVSLAKLPKVRESVAHFLPSNPVLNVSAASRVGTTERAVNWYLTLGQEFELAGQGALRADAAQGELRAQQHRVEVTRRELLARAWSAYFTALATRERLALATKLEAASREVAVTVRAMADNGVASAVEAEVADAAALRASQARIDGERGDEGARLDGGREPFEEGAIDARLHAVKRALGQGQRVHHGARMCGGKARERAAEAIEIRRAEIGSPTAHEREFFRVTPFIDRAAHFGTKAKTSAELRERGRGCEELLVRGGVSGFVRVVGREKCLRVGIEERNAHRGFVLLRPLNELRGELLELRIAFSIVSPEWEFAQKRGPSARIRRSAGAFLCALRERR